MITNALSISPVLQKMWELYQGRIDSCGAGFRIDGDRACRPRFKSIIWPCCSQLALHYSQ